MANVNVLDYLQHVFDPMKCSIAKAFSTDEDDDQMEDGEVGGAGRAVGEERTTTATGRKRIEITIKNNSDPESANNGALPVRIPIYPTVQTIQFLSSDSCQLIKTCKQCQVWPLTQFFPVSFL